MAEIDSIVSIITDTIRIPSTWVNNPILFINNIVFPGFFNFLAFYYIMQRLMFKTNNTPNILLGLVFTVLSLPYGPTMMYFSPLIVAFLGLQSWSARIIFLDIAYVLRFFIIPLIASFPAKVNVQQLFIYFLPALLGTMMMIKTNHPLWTWVYRIIFLVAIYYVWIYVIPLIYV